jgi:NADH:ubiquinone oxidoreductase subunit 2 (subunit N)
VVLGGSSVALPDLLFISSLLSLIIGTVLGLAQTQIKRLLA